MDADNPVTPQFSPHLKNLVLLAWSRSLDLPDETLLEAAMQDNPERIEIPTDQHPDSSADSSIATFIRLFNVSILYGPTWLLDAARDIDHEVLALESTMLRLAGGKGRSLGETLLYYMDEPPIIEPSDAVAVSHMVEHAKELETCCPADDVFEVSLSEMDDHFVLVPADADGHQTGAPVAGAGYQAWEGLLAGLSVLTDPAHRRQGLGRFAVGVAIEEAFIAGLIPQWKAPIGHSAAHHMANSLGFQLAGSQTTFYFG